jgi:hypothetical protein
MMVLKICVFYRVVLESSLKQDEIDRTWRKQDILVGLTVLSSQMVPQ